MTTTKDQWFSSHIGHRHRFEGKGSVVELPVTEYLCVPGTGAPRLAVLATVADIAGGSLVQEAINPYVPLTIDLDVRRRSTEPVGHLTGFGRLTKRGGTICVTEVTYVDTERPDHVVAHSMLRFMRSPSPADVFYTEMLNYDGLTGTLQKPLAEALGVVVERPGLVTLKRWSYVLQPTGTIQGGAVTLLAEMAAETVLGLPVADIDVHFLSQVRTGPARVEAEPLWETCARIEVRDQGEGGRLVGLATAHAGPAV